MDASFRFGTYSHDCRGRILVVDQDDWCREFLTQVFKLLGFNEVRLVATAEEAFSALEESQFDLLITDLRLAEDQQLLDNCRQRFPTMRYIIMVERRSLTHQWFFQEQVQVVYKPLRLDEITRKIREAVHQKHRRQMEEQIRRLKQEVFRILE